MTIALAAVVPGDAALGQDQAFEPASPDTIPTIFREFRWAQTITVGVTGTLIRVDVLVAQLFSVQPEDLDVTIFSTSGGVPSLPVTAPFQIPADSIPVVSHPGAFESYAYVSASFALPVTAGQVLAIVVSTGSTSEYYWAGVHAGGYPGGAVYRTSSTSWALDGAQDQAFRTFVASSGPPTADAGSSQIVRPGTTVKLDGSGSFDDDTETGLLQYTWTFVSVPNGSAVTALTDANTITPSFIPDAPGNYVVQLVVTDADGLSSSPSHVTIGENLPPTASAGTDQLVVVNQPVSLNGFAIDADGDVITYGWHFTDKPIGSNAEFEEADQPSTTFTPDLPGAYVATLTPSDFLGPGVSANATITVATANEYAQIRLHAAAGEVGGLPADAVTTEGNQNALVQLLSNTVVALQNGNLSGARQQLEHAISRTDGCAMQGAADGNGPGRDWITLCAAQEQVYPLLAEALATITQ